MAIKSLLITARDPATAHAVTQLLNNPKRKRFKITVIAENPAFIILQERVKPPVKLKLFTRVKEKSKLIEHAKTLLETIEPNVVLCGVSGPDYGIDEAVLSVAGKKYKTHALQGFWGDLNSAFKSTDSVYFVLDKFAKRMTVQRVPNSHVVVIGSLKHEGYKALNVSSFRKNFLNLAELAEDKPLISLMGQPLHQVPGYCDSLQTFIQELSRVELPLTFCYRPHPKENKKERDWLIRQVKKHFPHAFIDESREVEGLLSASDIVVSAFSTCGYDLERLNQVSQDPLGIPLYLLFNEELKAWFQTYTKLEDMPVLSGMTSHQVTDLTELSPIITLGLDKSYQKEHWQRLRTQFQEEKMPSEKIFDYLLGATHA